MTFDNTGGHVLHWRNHLQTNGLRWLFANSQVDRDAGKHQSFESPPAVHWRRLSIANQNVTQSRFIELRQLQRGRVQTSCQTANHWHFGCFTSRPHTTETSTRQGWLKRNHQTQNFFGPRP
jgi:hypothetical protein